MTFQAKLAEARGWKRILKALAILIDEATFTINDEGLKCRVMDPSHVAMVDLKLPKTIFDEYTCDGSLRACFNVNEMLRMLRRPGKEGLEISLGATASQLKIVLKELGFTRTFTMATLEPMKEDIPTSKIPFNSSVKILAQNLRNALEDVAIVTDFMAVKATQSIIVFEAKGVSRDARIEFPKGCESILSLEVKEPSKATYSLNYLNDIVKAGSGLSDLATWNFSTDMPVRLDFELPKGGRLQYYLSPRIER